jgi:hypothetical protein
MPQRFAELEGITGVWAIVGPSGKQIGADHNVAWGCRRVWNYLQQKKKCSIPTTLLIADWKKYGPGVFKWVLVTKCSSDVLSKKRKEYINSCRANGEQIYNGIKSIEHREEIAARFRQYWREGSWRCPPRGSKLSLEEQKEALDLFNSGANYLEVAKAIKHDPGTVRRLLLANEIPLTKILVGKRHYSNLPQDEQAQILSLFSSGLAYEVIARKVNHSIKRVRSVLLAQGIPLTQILKRYRK